MSKLSWNKYLLDMANAVKQRSSCSRRQIGAVITTRSHEIITTGYNGTPSNHLDCNLGGCMRCESDAPSGTGYEYCLCVHAEMNAIYSAAKQGKSVTNSILYVSDMPCIQCVKALVQCQIRYVYYDIDGVSVDSPLSRDDYKAMIGDNILFMEYVSERDAFAPSNFYHGFSYARIE